MFPLNSRFLFWLIALLGFYVVLGRSQSQKAPPRFNNEDKKSSDFFRHAMRNLVDAGAHKIFEAEHHDFDNTLMYANTLAGLSASGLPVNLFVEMHHPGRHGMSGVQVANDWRQAMKAFNSGKMSVSMYPEYIRLMMDLIKLTQRQNEAAFVSRFPSFETRLLNRSVTMNLINFETAATDLTSFIQYDGVAVAQLGSAHALGTVTKLNHFAFPWDPFQTELPDAFGMHHKTLKMQKASFNGLNRAAKRGPAVLVTTAMHLMWQDYQVNKRQVVFNHLLSNGYSALEVRFPLLKDSLFIFSPCSLLPTMQTVVAGENDRHLFSFSEKCPKRDDKGEL